MVNIEGATLKEKRIIKKVEKACFEHLGQENFFAIDIAIVGEEDIRSLNERTRGVDKVTDVLSYPCFDRLKLPVKRDEFSDADCYKNRVVLGSIVICRQRAIDQAKEYGHTYEREIGFLACHGFLHILGFDHIVEDDEKVMFANQRAIMDKVGLKRG